MLLRIQIVRAIAANLVVLSHFGPAHDKYIPGGWLPYDLLHYGAAGVDIFFAISGFIIVVSGAAMPPLEFLWRRASRIYPILWFVIIVRLAAICVLPVDSQLPSPETLWHSFLLIPDGRMPFIAVSWTLNYEVYFYAVFAVILASRLPIYLGLAAWGAVLMMLHLVAPGVLAASPAASTYADPLVAEFMMGALAGLAYRRGFTRGANAAGFVGIAGLAITITLIAPLMHLDERANYDLVRTIAFGAPAALLVYWLGVRERQRKARPPRWLVVLGDASYSTYLTHAFALAAVGRVLAVAGLSGIVGSIAFVILVLICANLAGTLLFLGIERPVLRALKQISPFPAARAAPKPDFREQGTSCESSP